MPFKQFQQYGYFERALANTRTKFLQLNQSNISNSATEFEQFEYLGILDVDLTASNSKEHLAFKVTVCVLCCLSVCGNISTLGVNSTRKMRPFFRACLISLAISDLLNTIFSTTVYVAQLSTDYVQIWILGNAMCGLIPFGTTIAALASSMTLVIIALDRYFAVMKALTSKWKPENISGVICMLIIWVITIGIACPVFWIYHIMTVYIVTEVKSESEEVVEQRNWRADDSKKTNFYALVQSENPISMCVSDQKDFALYYIIVFSIIFAPCIISFVWLNATVARKIWIRRHKVSHNTEFNERKIAPAKLKNSQEVSADSKRTDFAVSNTKISTITTVCSAGSSYTKPYNISSTREGRHQRMVIVLILLIAVFLCLRLPAWIFLLMRMYGSYSKPHDWTMYFVFGILNLISCALNPLFYTFLHETIQYILCCKMKCNLRRRRVQRCIGECKCGSSLMSNDDDSMVNFGCCACFGIFCAIFGMGPRANISRCTLCNTKELSFSDQNKSRIGQGSVERDEGVDCSDGCYDESDDDDDNGIGNDNENLSIHCNQQIFTVFSVSLIPLPTDLSLKSTINAI